jgi:hypothetical protein
LLPPPVEPVNSGWKKLKPVQAVFRRGKALLDVRFSLNAVRLTPKADIRGYGWNVR